jgi:hypothetical protein
VNRRGLTSLELILVLAVLGAAGIAVGPKIFSGDSRRADKSEKATHRLEEATQAQGASAAASVAKIGEANALAPESPARDYISREVPVALSKLPTPDPEALLQAERRRAAVMEGRLDEARRLFEIEAKRASQLQQERDAALIARRQADVALQEAAAAERARTQQALGIGALAILLGGGWLWARFNGFSLRSIADIRASVLKGEPLEVAIDRLASPRQQVAIRREVATKIDLPGKA